jgi:hypothetical protein
MAPAFDRNADPDFLDEPLRQKVETAPKNRE